MGRETEQQRIDALLAGARVGQSGVLVVSGDAGIGKTALLAHARQVTAAMTVQVVVGTEAERELPFAGLAQLVRPTAAELDRLPPPQAEALAVALALRPGAGVDRFAVGAALLTLLTSRSEDRPVCVLVDDAQLLDRPSQEAMVFVARRLLADAVAVVVTARADEPCLFLDADLPQLRLPGLDATASRALTSARLGVTATTELAERVHALSGGNPLAIGELVRQPEVVLALPPEAPGPAPQALAELYGRRAAALPAAGVTALRVAATVGDDLRVTARACAELGVAVDELAGAEALGLVSVRDERVVFAHPLVRSGVYASTPPGERRRLHGAIAAALADGDPDRRAWHRSEAVLGTDAGAAAEMQQVAERAAGRGAYSVAAAGADRAAGLSVTDADRADRLYAAGRWSWYAGESERANALLAAAVALEPVPGLRARSRQLLGIIATRTGAVDAGRDLLLRAAAESVDPSEAVACYAEAIDACFYLADASSGLAAARQADLLLDRAAPDAAVLGLMAAGVGKVLAGADGTGQIAEAVRRAEMAAAAAEPSTAAVRPWEEVAWLVIGPLFLRDSSSGRDLIRSAVEDQRARSAVGALPHLLFHIARDQAATDRWAQAESDYTEAAALAAEFGQSTELAMSLAGLAWLEARQGRPEAATRHATEAIDLADRHTVEIARLWAGWALADLALGSGDISAALERYGEVEARLARLGVRDVDLSPAPELVEVLVRSGRADEAEPLRRSYAESAAAKGQPWARARAARAEGLLADDDALDEVFGRALLLHAATLDAYEQARTELAYGSRLRRARRRVDARSHLRRSSEIFTRLGARTWATVAADEAAASGLTVARPGSSPAEQLTPRELQVASLLAQGRTTREVASALFLSPKTVEYHLRHVYTKFGIDTRGELRALLAPSTPRSLPPPRERHAP